MRKKKMSKLFSLDLKKCPEYTVSHNGLTVTIRPLPKSEDKKLIDEYTQGKVSIFQTRAKRGFRNTGKDEIKLPDVDHIGLNTARAQLTWKDWNLSDDSKQKVPCNSENIKLLFENYYDAYALPIIEKLEEQIGAEEEDKSGGKQKSEGEN